MLVSVGRLPARASDGSFQLVDRFSLIAASLVDAASPTEEPGSLHAV